MIQGQSLYKFTSDRKKQEKQNYILLPYKRWKTNQTNVNAIEALIAKSTNKYLQLKTTCYVVTLPLNFAHQRRSFRTRTET